MQTVTKTSRALIRPLSALGSPLLELRPQVLRLLQGTPGLNDADLQALFTEPTYSSNRDEITWLTPGRGQPQAFSSLDEATRETARQTLKQHVQAIQVRIEALEQGDSNDIEDAGLLKLALNIPDGADEDHCKYLLGERPVLVNWGCAPKDGEAHSLTDLRYRVRQVQKLVPPAPAFQVVDEAPVLPVVRRRHWWHWLAWLIPLLVLSALILFWLLRGQLIGMPSWLPGWRMTPPAMTAPNALSDAEAALRRELDELTIALGERRLQCRVADRARITQEVEARQSAALAVIGDDASEAELYEATEEETEEMLDRCLAVGCEQGTLAVSLFWEGNDDVDLHVLTPSGGHINFSNKQGQHGGVLDVDANSGNQMTNPVENVRWTAEHLEPGRYVFGAKLHNNRNPDSLPLMFTMVVNRNGQTQTYRGTFEREKEIKFIAVLVP